MVILEKGNLPLPRCPRCDLQVTRKALNRRHLKTNQCKKGEERKQQRLAAAKVETTSEKAFHAYGTKMRAVTEFRYLGSSGPPRRLGSPGCTKLIFPRRAEGDSARLRDTRGCQ